MQGLAGQRLRFECQSSFGPRALEGRRRAQQREVWRASVALRRRSLGPHEPSLARLQASYKNSKLNFKQNSNSGLGGSCEELASALCARCSRAIGFAHAPVWRAISEPQHRVEKAVAQGSES